MMEREGGPRRRSASGGGGRQVTVGGEGLATEVAAQGLRPQSPPARAGISATAGASGTARGAAPVPARAGGPFDSAQGRLLRLRSGQAPSTALRACPEPGPEPAKEGASFAVQWVRRSASSRDSYARPSPRATISRALIGPPAVDAAPVACVYYRRGAARFAAPGGSDRSSVWKEFRSCQCPSRWTRRCACAPAAGSL